MAKQRCLCCVGSGKVMGGGMLYSDCDKCDGTGKIYVDEPIDQNSHRYKEAIENIKALDSKMSDEDAKKLFDSEMTKLNESAKDSKNGKPSNGAKNSGNRKDNLAS
jgi:RecJ-like exonuclease